VKIDFDVVMIEKPLVEIGNGLVHGFFGSEEKPSAINISGEC
jgi:hypothetical protein